MLNTKKYLYILPDSAYVAELLPAKKPHTFAIQAFRQINGEFLDDNEFIAENVEKLIKKMEPDEYHLILPDFLFTNTIVDVKQTDEGEVKKYLKEQLLPSLDLSKETHEIDTFILTQHQGKSKVQLSALEKSLLAPIQRAAAEQKLTISSISPLSWTIKSVVSLEPSISTIQIGGMLYLAQHYIGVDQTISFKIEETENIAETVKTLKGAEPNIQTMYLLTNALVENNIKEKLSGTLPIQQLATFSDEQEGIPSYIKQIIEATAKTLDISDYPVPKFSLGKYEGVAAEVAPAEAKEEAKAEVKTEEKSEEKKAEETALAKDLEKESPEATETKETDAPKKLDLESEPESNESEKMPELDDSFLDSSLPLGPISTVTAAEITAVVTESLPTPTPPSQPIVSAMPEVMALNSAPSTSVAEKVFEVEEKEKSEQPVQAAGTAQSTLRETEPVMPPKKIDLNEEDEKPAPAQVPAATPIIPAISASTAVPALPAITPVTPLITPIIVPGQGIIPISNSATSSAPTVAPMPTQHSMMPPTNSTPVTTTPAPNLNNSVVPLVGMTSTSFPPQNQPQNQAQNPYATPATPQNPPMSPLSMSNGLRQRPVIKNKSDAGSLVKVVGITLGALIVTVALGVGIGFGLLKLSEKKNNALDHSPVVVVSPTPVDTSMPTPPPSVAPTPPASPAPAKDKLKVLIVNATKTAGLAGKLKTALTSAGYKSVSTGNAKGTYSTPGDFALLKTDDETLVSTLSTDSKTTLTFQNGKDTEDPKGAYDVVIVINQ